VLLLYAVWLSHLALFRAESWASWTGFLIVVQNTASSLFNSHLSDFQEGGSMCWASASPKVWCFESDRACR
jgi:hypothetical protein